MVNLRYAGRNVFIPLLIFGLTVGFTGCTSTPVQPPPVCADVTGEDQVIELRVVAGKIIGNHDPATVKVANCDQVVWEWVGVPAEEFSVSLEWVREYPPTDDTDPSTPVDHPANPFIRPYIPIPGGNGWESSNGKIFSGLAKVAAKGHEYKFIIKALNNSEIEPLDPHIRFD